MICEKKDCVGCFACYNICPKHAIDMVEDENGYIYPKINDEKCVRCGLCKKVCPSLNYEKNDYENIKCYAAYSKINDIRSKSTSGGVATNISKKILEDEGIIYGVAFKKMCNVAHIRITDINDISKLQGSKYVHSYIFDTYSLVKKDLNNFPNKKILFIGAPCQIAGLKSFLMKDYNNLILMDIICHGVPSQKFLKEEVERINKDLYVDRVNFRNGNEYGFFIEKDKKIIFKAKQQESPYCDAFFNRLSLRENCYSCKYANPNRISDITIGDFWGLDKNSLFYKERDKGISVVIISTKKGKDFFEKYIGEFSVEERSYKEAIKGNTQLRRPSSKPKNADAFKKDCYCDGFYKAYKKNTKVIRAKRKIKEIVKKIVRR